MLIKITTCVFLVTFLSSCTGVGYWQGPDGKRSCKAICSTLAEDGKSCVEWSEAASDTCAGKPTYARACCTNQGTCPAANGTVKGLGCSCAVYNNWGTMIGSIPGQGCN